ncbi:MAG: hypothetical protein RIT14_1480 [Pseudomonadota bacterium]
MVDDLLDAAFGGAGEERDLVRALRAAGLMELELVTPRDGAVVAYAGVCRMVEPAGWLCLAPVGVDPRLHGQGLGSHIVRRALALLPGRMVVVLGDPGFYARLGFSGRRAARLRSVYPVTHLLLAGPGADVPEVQLIYPPPFDGL